MSSEETKQLGSETRKQILIAAKNKNASQIAQLIFRSLNPRPPAQPEPPGVWPPGISFTLWSLQPSPLEPEEDIFDALDIVHFSCDKYLFLDEKELNASVALIELVSIAAKRGAFEAAWNISRRIKERGEKERAHETIISEYLKAGELDKAFENRFKIEYKTTRLELLCRIAAYQFSAGKRDECLKTIGETLDTAEDEFYFDRAKFRARMALLQAKLGEFDSAYATIKIIDREDIKAIALCKIAVMLAQAGKRKESQESFAKALAEAKNTQYSPNRCKALLMVIEAQAETGDFESAVSAAKSLEWDAERAAYLDGIFADGLPKSFFGCGCCTMKSYREEFEVLTTRDKGLSRVAGAQARLGDTAGAMKTIQLIEWNPLYAEALFLIGKAHANNGNRALAKENFAFSLDACVNRPCRNQPAFLRDLALEQARIGDIEHALVTARFIDFAVSKAEALTEIGEIQGQTGDWEAPREAFNEAIEAANDVGYINWRIDALLKIALSQFELGWKGEAPDVFEAASNQLETIKELSWKVGQFLKIAASLVKAGEREQARLTLRVVRDLAEKANDVEQIRNVAVALAENGFKEEAVAASKAIVASPAGWPWVASVFAEHGDLEKFIRMLLLGSYDWVTAQKVCVLLGEAYPDQVEAIADVVVQFMES